MTDFFLLLQTIFNMWSGTSTGFALWCSFLGDPYVDDMKSLARSVGVVLPAFVQGSRLSFKICLPLKWRALPLHSLVSPLEFSADVSRGILRCIFGMSHAAIQLEEGVGSWRWCSFAQMVPVSETPKVQEHSKSWNLNAPTKFFYLSFIKIWNFHKTFLYL